MGNPPSPASQPTPADPQAVFLQAAGFEYAAVVLARFTHSRLTEGVSGKITLPTLIPEVTNRAFAVELYLKCLLLLETGQLPRKTHNLKELFDRLSGASQQKIRAACGSHAFFDQILTPVTSFFDRMLDESQEAFNEWRYYHENHPTAGSDTYGLMVAVRKTILDLKPDWKQWLDAMDAQPTPPANS